MMTRIQVTACRLAGATLPLAAVAIAADARTVVDTSKSPHVQFRPIGLESARWTTGFWAVRYDLNRRTTIPTMKRVMELPTNSATFHNLRVAGGERSGKFFGNDWGDGDCYKWIEAAASTFAQTRDPELDRQMDEVIAVVAKAQAPDGYISTQTQLTGKKRWTNLNHHELYNMGHLLTAACIHHRATGKTTFLDVARRLADYLLTVFEPRPKELAHFCFNPSNIMGVAELYRTTGDRRYLRLAQIFVAMRGSQPGGSDQNQAKVPLLQEKEAVGHAVTGAYLWCGAADVCAETGEPALLEALKCLWDDVTTRKMYITGGTAALHRGVAHRVRLNRGPIDAVHEAFGAPYQLPNRTAYNETCASIALAMWSWRMLALTGDAKYADAMERVFYNSMLSGIGVEGQDYFYTNPLRRAGKDVPLLNNDSAKRWPNTTPESPVHCFCCPPNIARTVAQLHTYAYSVSENVAWIHLYGSSTLETRLSDGVPLRLSQTTDYPWNGKITIALLQTPEREVSLRLRIPGWADRATIAVNGQPAAVEPRAGSYCDLRRRWMPGDTVVLELPMSVALMESHPLVEENRNHIAVMRGPLVYCLEAVDLPSGTSIDDVRVPRGAQWKTHHQPDMLRGVTVLETQAKLLPSAAARPSLYQQAADGKTEAIDLRMIPYYAWCNRGACEMIVWLPLF